MDLITLALLACVAPNIDKAACQKQFLACVERTSKDERSIKAGYNKEMIGVYLATKDKERKEICKND